MVDDFEYDSSVAAVVYCPVSSVVLGGDWFGWLVGEGCVYPVLDPSWYVCSFYWSECDWVCLGVSDDDDDWPDLARDCFWCGWVAHVIPFVVLGLITFVWRCLLGCLGIRL